MGTVENVQAVEKLKNRYSKFNKLLLVITIIYLFWTIFHLMSVYFLGFGNKWAILTMDEWIISSIILYCIIIALLIIGAIHVYIVKKQKTKKAKPKAQYYKGKQLHVYTQPSGAKGGIFSKTFVQVDENNILTLRYQMIPPENLWRNY